MLKRRTELLLQAIKLAARTATDGKRSTILTPDLQDQGQYNESIIGYSLLEVYELGRVKKEHFGDL